MVLWWSEEEDVYVLNVSDVGRTWLVSLLG